MTECRPGGEPSMGEGLWSWKLQEITHQQPWLLVPVFCANKLYSSQPSLTFELESRYLLVFCYVCLDLGIPIFFSSYKFLSFYVSQHYDCQNITEHIVLKCWICQIAAIKFFRAWDPWQCSLSRRTECAEPCGTEGRAWDTAQASPPGVRVRVCKVVFQPFSSPVLSFTHIVLVITLSDHTGKGEGHTAVWL